MKVGIGSGDVRDSLSGVRMWSETRGRERGRGLHDKRDEVPTRRSRQPSGFPSGVFDDSGRFKYSH
jgi:hypothetical protein